MITNITKIPDCGSLSLQFSKLTQKPMPVFEQIKGCPNIGFSIDYNSISGRQAVDPTKVEKLLGREPNTEELKLTERIDKNLVDQSELSIIWHPKEWQEIMSFRYESEGSFFTVSPLDQRSKECSSANPYESRVFYINVDGQPEERFPFKLEFFDKDIYPKRGPQYEMFDAMIKFSRFEKGFSFTDIHGDYKKMVCPDCDFTKCDILPQKSLSKPVKDEL